MRLNKIIKTISYILSLQLLRLSDHVRKIAHYVYSCLCVCVCEFYPKQNPYRWHILPRFQPNWGITLKLWINWMNLKMFQDWAHVFQSCELSCCVMLRHTMSHNICNVLITCSGERKEEEPKRNTRHFISIKIEYAVSNTCNMYSFCYLLFNNTMWKRDAPPVSVYHFKFSFPYKMTIKFSILLKYCRQY